MTTYLEDDVEALNGLGVLLKGVHGGECGKSHPRAAARLGRQALAAKFLGGHLGLGASLRTNSRMYVSKLQPWQRKEPKSYRPKQTREGTMYSYGTESFITTVKFGGLNPRCHPTAPKHLKPYITK
eukprot:scaffold148804_cov38-Prasinocladus_malaysianus.AAC.1